MTLICTITSKLQVKTEDNVLEPGFHELAVHVRMSEATASGDVPGFVKKEIARHLAGCIASTGIPLGERMWDIRFSKFAQNNFNYPEGFTA